MKRRTFLTRSLATAGIGGLAAVGAGVTQAPPAQPPGGPNPAAPPPVDPPDKPAAAPQGPLRAPHVGPVLAGSPVVFGPAAESLAILQPLRGPATGYLEYAIGDQPMQRIDAAASGLLPFDEHVLKFHLPPLPPGSVIRYRVTARVIDFLGVYKIVPGLVETSDLLSFRTLDPQAAQTRFVVWNDTHENAVTLKALREQTEAINPDFLLWNGDQTNDVLDEAKIAGQILAPYGHPVAARWPLAYARGNHDVRGPAARLLPRFTGTPEDRFYYAFRSGPLAALVMDTGEDKPDAHPVFAGLAAFEPMRARQTAWLAAAIEQPWFRQAPFKLLFCHIPLWWIDEVKDVGHWRFSKVCRDAWLPLLEKAGVKLVISGHTHDFAWLPAGADRPLGQLIGGAPAPRFATIIEGAATKERLTITMRKIDGKVLQKLEFGV